MIAEAGELHHVAVVVPSIAESLPFYREVLRMRASEVHEIAEHGRTAIRLERRDANEALKKLLKDKAISEDDEKRALDSVQKQTDAHIKQMDELAKHKEDEILKI